MFRSRKLSYSYPSTTGQFNADYADLPLKKCILHIPVTQQGSGTPSLDNIRDFIGVSGVNVSRTGINIWDEIVESGRINVQTGQNTTADNRFRSKNYIPVVGGETYYFKSPTLVFIFCYDANKNFILNPNGETSNYISVNSDSAIMPINCKYIRVVPNATYGTTYNYDISVNYPSTDTSYHAYTGNTYQITFGQTVYSANLDVLTGKLPVTHIRKAMSDFSWQIVPDSSSGLGFNYFRIADNIEDMNSLAQLVCDCLVNDMHSRGDLRDGEIGRYNSSSYNRRLVCRVDSITTIEDWNTFIADKYIVYELATPIEIPLGGIDIKTLQGVNNIFADIGTVETQCIKLGN